MPSLRGATVLVVDDEEAALRLTRGILERSEFDILTADGGREALEILRRDSEKKIAAVVLDLAMPGLDGPKTFLEIRSLRSRLPVNVASGSSQKMAADRFPPNEIAAVVRELILKPAEGECLDSVPSSLSSIAMHLHFGSFVL